MEDFELDIVIGRGGVRGRSRCRWSPSRWWGPRRGPACSRPCRARFGIVQQLDFYTPQDIEEIVRRSADSGCADGGCGGARGGEPVTRAPGGQPAAAAGA
jgi:Holliday junction resolvasome RuvABC ATP-dependent DNA helicase subunit